MADREYRPEPLFVLSDVGIVRFCYRCWSHVFQPKREIEAIENGIVAIRWIGIACGIGILVLACKGQAIWNNKQVQQPRRDASE